MAINKCSPKKVTFKITAPNAKDVRLAGDFNSWDASSSSLKKSKEICPLSPAVMSINIWLTASGREILLTNFS
jgi:hypothetical protein